MGLLGSTTRKNQSHEAQVNWQYRQMEMDKQQMQWFEQFNAQNEYNSPDSQLKRLYDANINPIFGMDEGMSGASSANLNPPSASGNVSSLGSGSFLTDLMNGLELGKGVLDSILDIRGDSRAERSANNDTVRTLAESGYKKAAAEYAKQQAQGQAIRNDSERDMRMAQLQEYADKHDLSEEEKEVKKATVAQLKSYSNELEKRSQNAYDQLQELIRHNKAMEDVARQNASTDAQNAATNAGLLTVQQNEYGLSEQRFEHEKGIDKSAIDNRRMELENRARELDDEEFFKALEATKTRFSFKGLFFGYNNQEKAMSMVALVSVANGRLQKMSPDDPRYAMYQAMYNQFVDRVNVMIQHMSKETMNMVHPFSWTKKDIPYYYQMPSNYDNPNYRTPSFER